MQTRRWTNPSLPQPLQIAVILLYISAFFDIINGIAYSVVFLAVGVAQAAAGYGIANTQKWGWSLGVGVTALELVLLLVLVSPGDLLRGPIITLLFVGARFLLLLQRESREHVRIWFD